MSRSALHPERRIRSVPESTSDVVSRQDEGFGCVDGQRWFRGVLFDGGRSVPLVRPVPAVHQAPETSGPTSGRVRGGSHRYSLGPGSLFGPRETHRDTPDLSHTGYPGHRVLERLESLRLDPRKDSGSRSGLSGGLDEVP